MNVLEIQGIMTEEARKMFPGKEGFFGWPSGVPKKYRPVIATLIHRASIRIAKATRSTTDSDDHKETTDDLAALTSDIT